MRRWLFNLGYLWLAGLIWPWFLYKYATTGKYRAGLIQRFGNLPARGDKRSIWVHAVSVGELLQCRPLLKALRERLPQYDVVITYTTKTAAEIAKRDFADYYHCYSPLDLSWVVAKFFRVLNPALLILVELELWPNWLMHAKRKGVPVLLANGRISEHSFAPTPRLPSTATLNTTPSAVNRMPRRPHCSARCLTSATSLCWSAAAPIPASTR
jgi:3-deoxy-D-manno-octulosonic-acid transferase